MPPIETTDYTDDRPHDRRWPAADAWAVLTDDRIVAWQPDPVDEAARKRRKGQQRGSG